MYIKQKGKKEFMGILFFETGLLMGISWQHTHQVTSKTDYLLLRRCHRGINVQIIA